MLSRRYVCFVDSREFKKTAYLQMGKLNMTVNIAIGETGTSSLMNWRVMYKQTSGKTFS
jgi:hypothetical protein